VSHAARKCSGRSPKSQSFLPSEGNEPCGRVTGSTSAPCGDRTPLSSTPLTDAPLCAICAIFRLARTMLYQHPVGWDGTQRNTFGKRDPLLPAMRGALATRVRQRNRCENVTDDTFSSLVCRLRHECLGTPALALTPSNVARLWGLDRTTSECVLDFLAAHGYVQKTSNGVYTR